jgi:hypothetical protein
MWGLRLVYADWLEEHGEWAYAAAQRWLARHGIAPATIRTTVENQPIAYSFAGPSARPGVRLYADCELPEDVHASLCRRIGPGADGYRDLVELAGGCRPPFLDRRGLLYFRTPERAVTYLSEALLELGKLEA